MSIFSKKKQVEPETAIKKVGVGQKVDQKVRDTGKGFAISGLQRKINQLVQEKRLVFVSGESLDYTNKQGVKKTLSFDAMTAILVDASGFDNLVALGITPNDVRALLSERYNEIQGRVKEIGTG